MQKRPMAKDDIGARMAGLANRLYYNESSDRVGPMRPRNAHGVEYQHAVGLRVNPSGHSVRSDLCHDIREGRGMKITPLIRQHA